MVSQLTGASLDEQADRPADIGQQATLPMEKEQLRPKRGVADAVTLDTGELITPVEQQPTAPLKQLLQALVEELATLPELGIVVRQQAVSQRGRKKVLRWAVISSFYVVLIVSIVVGHTALLGWVSAITTPAQQPGTTASVAILHPHRSSTTASPITSATGAFMQAFMHKQWATSWAMLAPDAQMLFTGEADFIHFEQSKFDAVTLSTYQAGSAELVQPWLDPDSTHVYAVASVVHISLVASASPRALASLSVADLHNGLFANTTLAMIPHNGQWQVVLAGPADLDAPVLVPATPPTVHLLVPIFMYHHVSNQPTNDALDYSLTVTATDFNAQLDWLQQQGYTSINMTELFDSLYDGKALPPHPMILTFDDGYADVYANALPALLAHHDRGVFYIITGMIGGWYMTWDQVHILQDEGMQIASHTVHHVNVGQPPSYTSTQAELLQSKATLQAKMGVPIQFFCYPTGEPFHHDSVAEQQIVLQDLFADSYIGATLDPAAFDSAIQNAQTPYQLPRIRVSGGETLSAYIGTLNSVLTYDAQQLSSTNG